MSSLNKRIPRTPVRTHGGAPASAPPSSMIELRRAVLSCLLWEDQFYESGQSIADRIVALVNGQDRSLVGNLALEARSDFNLRHVPLLLLAAMVEHGMKPSRDQINNVIQRPDEMGELLAILWRNGKRPVPKQVKLGIGDAFNKFSPYSLSKYNSARKAIKLKDVLRIVHPTPANPEKSALFKSIIDGTLASADTWEVALSSGADKKETFERLIREGQLGYLALLRNLRNMEQAGVDRSLVANAIRARQNGADRVLPFRFIAANRAAPSFAAPLNDALLATMDGIEPIGGSTIVLVDISGSMRTALSARSDMSRMDAAAALGALFPGDDVRVFSFSSRTVEVPAFRGLPGVDAIKCSQSNGSTALAEAVAYANTLPHDRLVVITDEQSTSYSRTPAPVAKGYMINVASYRNGVSYEDWIKIDGFSESIFRFIREIENA